MRAALALMLALLAAGCLGAPPPAGPAPAEPGGPEPALLALGGCRGTIGRFLAPLDAMRPYVHEAFALYEGTDAQQGPTGRTAVSVSAYECGLGGSAGSGAQGVAFIFARVAPPEGVDVAAPLTYVARFYAAEPVAAFAAAHGLPGVAAEVTLDLGGALPNAWSASLDAGDEGTFEGTLGFDPLGASDTEGSGPFLAVSANATHVTWLQSNISVTARPAAGRATATGAFGTFTGGQPTPFSAAVVDPLEFPIVLSPVPWDGSQVPPPPAARPRSHETG